MTPPGQNMEGGGPAAAFCELLRECNSSHVFFFHDCQSVAAFQSAICLTPDDHFTKAAYHGGLGLSLLKQYERLGQLSSLEKAIADVGSVQSH